MREAGRATGDVVCMVAVATSPAVATSDASGAAGVSVASGATGVPVSEATGVATSGASGMGGAAAGASLWGAGGVVSMSFMVVTTSLDRRMGAPDEESLGSV
jgi:hypothetical protein